MRLFATEISEQPVGTLDRARQLVAEAIADSQATGEGALLFGNTILAAFRVLSIAEPDALSAELSKLEAGQAREVRRRLYEIERQTMAGAADFARDAADDRPVEIDLAALANRDPEPPAFIVPDLLPEGEVTLLAADGGTGKSLIALFLAVCIVLGRAFHGVSTARRAVDYLSFERIRPA